MVEGAVMDTDGRRQDGEVGSADSWCHVAEILSLVDLARNDRGFAADLRRDPVAASSRLGIRLRDAEWAGLRDLLIGEPGR
jgi:hypothetical protein